MRETEERERQRGFHKFRETRRGGIFATTCVVLFLESTLVDSRRLRLLHRRAL